jgi:prevent-host-death family protein
MHEPDMKTEAMKISSVKSKLSSLVHEVSRGDTRVLVEQGGRPVAAIVSIEDLEQLIQLDKQRAERWQILEAMRAPFRGVPHEEIESEVAKAVAEVREEMRAEREAATKSA